MLTIFRESTLHILAKTTMNTVSRPTISECAARLSSIFNKSYYCPKTRDKGIEGKKLEELLGIPTSSECWDCSDGEIKIVPLKKLKVKSIYGSAGDYVPKETVAITMANTTNVMNTGYENSKLCKKIKNILFVGYIREETNPDNIIFVNSVQFNENFSTQRDKIQSDYETIKQTIVNTGTISGKVGKMIQMRTKGAGRGAPKTRGFYFKKPFLIDIGLIHRMQV